MQITFETAVKELDTLLCPCENFDLVKRNLIIGGRQANLYFIDGFVKNSVFEKIMEFIFKIKTDELQSTENMDEFSARFMPNIGIDVVNDVKKAATAILGGFAAVVINGIDNILLVDTRDFPARSISEPEKDRTMRGAKDGFVETLLFNTALIRRRVKDPSLRMEFHQVGEKSKLDIAICYLEGKSSNKALKALRTNLKKINIKGLSMTQQALSEALISSSFFNPFPKIKFTERPDYAGACLLEGRVLVVIDNSPAVMILPTSFADFTKEANDYYFPPITASYIRITRLAISVITVILTPLFLFFINNPAFIPEWLSFIKLSDEPMLPVIFQLLILEFIIDGLKIASLNTPDNLSSSLSIIGGLLLSEFAITAGWFSPECILYMSFVAIASFSQPSFEMGYAQKFVRIALLILTQLFGIYGLIIGLVLSLVSMGLTKTLTGRHYLYPIIPFNAKDFLKLFIRTKIKE